MDQPELTFNTAELPEGDYSCSIIVTDNTGSFSEIPVSLTIDAGIGIGEEGSLSEVNPVSVCPNPFTHETAISFRLSERSTVSLEIFNINGEKVKTLALNSICDKGIHAFTWDGTDDNQNELSGGIYFYRLNTGKEYAGRIVVVK